MKFLLKNNAQKRKKKIEKRKSRELNEGDWERLV